MKTGIKALDAMTEQPITVKPDATLEECAKLMAEKHVGALLVKKDKKLSGIVTEQDIVRKVVAKGKNPVNEEAQNIMEEYVNTIAPDVDIFDALVKMRDNNIRHLPVIHNENLVGLLTLKDILKIQPQLFDLLWAKFELREEERKPTKEMSGKEGICENCGALVDRLYNVKDTFVCKNCREEL